MPSITIKRSPCCLASRAVPITEKDGQLYVKLNTGYYMPMVGLGTWQSSGETVRKSVRNAVLSGYHLIDCAHWYENEESVGDELQSLFKEGVIKREDLFITSKLHPSYMAKEDVVPMLKQQLKNLKLDYLDLYLIHWPLTFKKIEGSLMVTLL